MLNAIQIALERDRVRKEKEKILADWRDKFKTLTQREQEVMSLVTAQQIHPTAWNLHRSRWAARLQQCQRAKSLRGVRYRLSKGAETARLSGPGAFAFCEMRYR